MKNNSIIYEFLLLLPCLVYAIGGRGPMEGDYKSGLRNEKPAYMDQIGIEENLGKAIDTSVRFKNEVGQEVALQKYFGKLPVFLMLVYYDCPTLCSTHLNSVMGTLKNFDMFPGEHYEYVIVSIDPREGPQLAKKKKLAYLKEYGLEEYASSIHFLTGEQESIKLLSDQVGFKFAWDSNLKQWAHGAASFVLTPEAKVSFYHYGISINPDSFRLSLVEASDNKIGSVMDKVLLFCLRYDPNKKTYAFYAFNIMRVGAALMAIILAIFLGRFWFNNRKERENS